MDRRELLKMIALVTGGVVIGGELFLTGCTSPDKVADLGFTPGNIALLDEVGETIIPATSSPGAKAAKVGEFMKVYVNDCYNPKHQEVFMNGIRQVDEASQKMNSKSFVESTPQQRHDLLLSIEKEAKAYDGKITVEEQPQRDQAKKEMAEFQGAPRHYYTMMKQLTLLGFFTSKVGATQALRHVPVPGKYDGAFPYKKGDKAWAE
jgi:hypothetical protein